MNDLIERYVYAVRQHLPLANRDDIAEEIADDLHSRADERSAELGRPLTTDELSNLLKSYGHPRLVASRFGPQRALIGSSLLPFYYNTLKIVVTIVVILAALGAFVTIPSKANALASFAQFWSSVWTGAIFGVGIVTIVFAVMERLSTNVTASWNPRSLPAIQAGRFVPLSTSIAELLSNVALIIFVASPATRYWAAYAIFNHGADALLDFPLAFTPVWSMAWLAIVAIAAITVALNVTNIMRPAWWQVRSIVLIVTSFISLGVCVLLLQARTLIVPSPSHHGADLALAATAMNVVGLWIVASVAVAALVAIVLQVRLLVQDRTRCFNSRHDSSLSSTP